MNGFLPSASQCLNRWLPPRLLFLTLLIIILPSSAHAAPNAAWEGWFNIRWSDTPTGPGLETYWLTTDSGQSLPLDVAPSVMQAAGGVLAFNGQRVVVTARQFELAGRPVNRWSVQSIRLAAGYAFRPAAVIGPQAWIFLLCKFSDIADEPKDLAYVQGMYSSSFPGLDHYWREVSYDQINLVGSSAAGWYSLPQPRVSYVYDMDGDGDADLDGTKLAADCTAAADADVNFNNYAGINLLVNDQLEGHAWGGGVSLTLEGISKTWAATWLPPWAYIAISVTSHEMGHGFGLPHSSFDDVATYDNVWDVMSNDRSGCEHLGNIDPTYGCVAQHTISAYKDKLGWIPPGKKYTVDIGTRASFLLEQLALPTTDDYLMGYVPTSSTNIFYTVEARRLAGYDSKLPGPAVIIHQVDTTRKNQAHIIDSDDDNGDTGDAGAMWLPGESFEDSGILICVLGATDSGFVVEVSNQAGSGCSPTFIGNDGFDPGADNHILAQAVQPDGKIVVGGDFEILGGQERLRIGRLNPDGTLDASFNPGADGTVTALAVQPDGKILVGGYFKILGEAPRAYIGRLNADGTVDEGFDPGADGKVYALALQPDGKILVGGGFSILAKHGSARLGRLNPDGTLDTTFTAKPGNSIYALQVQPDGKILVGGQFVALNGQQHRGIGRFNPDGSIDDTFNADIEVANKSGIIYTIGMQPDGKILVGGQFGQVNGQPQSSLVRLNLDGSTDTAFRSGVITETGKAGSVSALALQADGKILVGGKFIALNGWAHSNLGRLNPDGSIDNLFQADTDGDVYSLVFQADDKIVVGGHFSLLGDYLRLNIGRLYLDGSVDTTLKPQVDAVVNALALQPDGKIVLGGDFTQLGGQMHAYIGRVGLDGSVDTAFTPNADDDVLLLSVQPDGKILVGGKFQKLNGQLHPYLGRLLSDGSLDTSFNPLANGRVSALALQPNGKIIVGGYFTQLDGQPRSYIGRLNPDGTLDPSFVPSIDTSPPTNGIFTLALQSDGKIIVGGQFTQVNGQPHQNLARLNPDGSLDAAFNGEANGIVTALAMQSSRIVVGGSFNLLNGKSRQFIGRLNGNGSLDDTFNPSPNGSVSALAVLANGKIVVGGTFSSLGGQSCANVGRLTYSGSLDNAFFSGAFFKAGAAANVSALVVQPDGKLVVGGSFDRLRWQKRNFIGRLPGDESAQQILSIDSAATEAYWLRYGAGPEVARVTFDVSLDGQVYTSLGEGRRQSADSLIWMVDLPPLPFGQYLYLRSRGYYATGQFNGSLSAVEHVQAIYLGEKAPADIIYLPLAVK